METCSACRPRSTAKREAILDAAQALFLAQGYASTSMDLVAARAGVSKATIYAHFSGKDDLFGAMIRRRCQGRLDFGIPPDISGLDARQTLTMVGGQLLDLLLSPEALAVLRIVVAESSRHPDLVRAYYEAGPLRGKAYLQAVIEALAARGELRCDDSWRAADLFVGMLRSDYFNRALVGLEQLDGRCVADTVAAAVEVMLRAYGAADQ